ncbi:MAG: hypothetical protein ACRC5M_07210 [Anaeroplasmataceae bacterium]
MDTRTKLRFLIIFIIIVGVNVILTMVNKTLLPSVLHYSIQLHAGLWIAVAFIKLTSYYIASLMLLYLLSSNTWDEISTSKRITKYSNDNDTVDKIISIFPNIKDKLVSLKILESE